MCDTTKRVLVDGAAVIDSLGVAVRSDQSILDWGGGAKSARVRKSWVSPEQPPEGRFDAQAFCKFLDVGQVWKLEK